MHEHSGQPQHGDDGLGEPLYGGVRGRDAEGQGRALLGVHTHQVPGLDPWVLLPVYLQAVDLEREGRLQEGLEQPGVL